MILNLEQLKIQFDEFYYQHKNDVNEEFLANLRQAKLRLDKYINIINLKQTTNVSFKQILKKKITYFLSF